MSTQVTPLGPAAEARRRVPAVIRILLVLDGRPNKALAAHIGISDTALSDRISGRTRWSADEVAAAADFFGVAVGILYEDPASIRDRLTAAPTGRSGLLFQAAA